MTEIGLFYGTTTGNTENIAQQIQDKLGAEKVTLHNVDGANDDTLKQYSKIIFGTSTWGEGEIQDDFDSFLSTLSDHDFSTKKIAIYGLGDSEGYPETFVDGIADIHDVVIANGGAIVGKVSTADYSFDASRAQVDDLFLGLPIDEDTESEQTDDRLKNWLENIEKAFA